MSLLAALLAVLLIVVDAIIYLPFVKAYDANLVIDEAKNLEAEEAKEEAETKAEVKEAAAPAQVEATPVETVVETAPAQENKPLNVLVLCVGAGTSAMFANAVNKGAEEKHLPVTARAEAFGGHTDILQDFQLVVLSPQVQSRYDEIKADADRYGIKIVRTKGAQYINLTRDPAGAVDFVVNESKK